MSIDNERSMLKDLAIREPTQAETAPTGTNTKLLKTNANRFAPNLYSRDISNNFFRAASTLPTGQLIKDDFFTLFEAVGALEIMDSKMDNGYLSPGETLEDDYDILQHLEPQDAIGIMDAMLCSEVAWHMGHPLSQTLFTSLYVNSLLWPEPTSLHDASFERNETYQQTNPMLHVALRAYCLLLIKTCDFVHSRISSESFYEEEDFVTNLYNRSLLSRFSVQDVLKESTMALEAISTLESLDNTARGALICRIEYRQALLQATALEPSEISGEGKAPWTKCLEALPPMIESHGQGRPVPDSFSVKVQRKLASTVPPRPIIDVSFDAAHGFLERMFTDAADGSDVVKCPRASNVLTFLRVFFSRKPQASLYVRCLLQSLIFSQARIGGVDAERDVIFDELQELVLPHHTLLDKSNAEVELPGDDRFAIWQRMSRWTAQLYDAYHDLSRALCMNRSRTRRMLCHLILDWDNLQLDLEDLDSELRRFTHEKPIFSGLDAWELPLSSWAYLQKLRQMEQIVQLGFELSIYHIDEWPGMYQYLHRVAEARQKHVERIYGFVHYRRSETKKASASFKHTLSVLAFLSEEATATWRLAQAFASLYLALDILGLLPHPPQRPYSTKEFRHALRLRPFLQIYFPRLKSPSQPFDQLDTLVDGGHHRRSVDSRSLGMGQDEHVPKALALLHIVDENCRKARHSLDTLGKVEADVAMCVGCEKSWRAGIKDITRAAVVVGVIGAQLTKWAKDGAKEGKLVVKVAQDVEREDQGGMSACWIVPTVTSC